MELEDLEFADEIDIEQCLETQQVAEFLAGKMALKDAVYCTTQLTSARVKDQSICYRDPQEDGTYITHLCYKDWDITESDGVFVADHVHWNQQRIGLLPQMLRQL